MQAVRALAVRRPDTVGEPPRRPAAGKLKEGDVQPWWHPPTGGGGRTGISEDRLWLPCAAAQYLETTGDQAVLDEKIPWLEAASLKDQQQEAYFEPTESVERATLFEHCARALDRSLDVGGHGLPLIGAGDWNDGMNRVGHQGRGESVWLGWFLHTVLQQFIPLCETRDTARAARYASEASRLAGMLERAWDGRSEERRVGKECRSRWSPDH